MSYDLATDLFFTPRAENSSLFGNDVTHLAEAPTVLPACKIGAVIDPWPIECRQIAARHARRDEPCTCGACEAARIFEKSV